MVFLLQKYKEDTMKKLFSLVILLIASLSLYACDESEDVPQDNEETASITLVIEGETTETHTIEFDEVTDTNLFELITSELDVTYDTTDYGPMITAIESISATEDYYIGFYKNDAFAQEGVNTISFEDGDTFTFKREEILDYVTFEIVGMEIETVFASINNHDDLLSVLESAVDVEYIDTDYGPQLLSVDDLTASEGNYIHISKNGVAASEGIGTIEYAEGDVFTFSLEWWDIKAYMLDTFTTFETNYIDSYLDTYNYYVLSALNVLDTIDQYTIDAPAYDDEGDGSSHIKYILAAQALSIDTTTAETNLLENATIDHLYSGSLMSLVLDDNAFQTQFLTAVDDANLTTLDLDTLSLVLLALNKRDIDTYNETIIETITTNLYTSSYGNNAATMAHVIIALISAGIDPSDEAFNYEDESLVDYFMTYHAGDGSFYYQLDNDTPDMMFTTPQAQLAVAMYYEFLDTNAAVHPFIYE
jgi:hypothetical protein